MLRLTQNQKSLVLTARPGAKLVRTHEDGWAALWKEGKMWVAQNVVKVDPHGNVWWNPEVSAKTRKQALRGI